MFRFRRNSLITFVVVFFLMQRSQIFRILRLTWLIQLLLVVMKTASLNLRSNHFFSLQITSTSPHKALCCASHSCSANFDPWLTTFFTFILSSFMHNWRSRQVCRHFADIFTTTFSWATINHISCRDRVSCCTACFGLKISATGFETALFIWGSLLNLKTRHLA